MVRLKGECSGFQNGQIRGVGVKNGAAVAALALLLATLAFHLFAGVRHLLMDAGIGASLRAGRASAWAVIAAGAAVLASAVAGLMR